MAIKKSYRNHAAKPAKIVPYCKNSLNKREIVLHFFELSFGVGSIISMKLSDIWKLYQNYLNELLAKLALVYMTKAS